MKILELTNFSAGADGVFARVKEESLRLAKKGHRVMIFSSNHVKGADLLAPSDDSIDNIKIKRFPAKKLGGESFMSWDFKSEALAFKPDIIIAHSYRHSHTLLAQKIARKIGAKVFLVTHAPFARSNTRSLAGKIAVSLYDSFIAPSKLKRFDKIIAITKWEIPYLKKLGIPDEKIAYIPNGIKEIFFKKKKNNIKEQKKMIFLGRIAPIKNLEVVIKALPLIKNKLIKLEIIGPAEENYLQKLKLLIKSLDLDNRVIIQNKKYDSEEQIKELDSSFIYILPSISEGMPQSLIEALARQKVCLASDNLGNKDLIQNSKNGFLFQTNKPESCASQINHILSLNKKEINKIKKAAIKSVEKFKWKNIIYKIDKLIKS